MTRVQLTSGAFTLQKIRMAAVRGSFLPAGALLLVACVVAFSAQCAAAVTSPAPGNSASLLSVVDYSKLESKHNCLTLTADFVGHESCEQARDPLASTFGMSCKLPVISPYT